MDDICQDKGGWAAQHNTPFLEECIAAAHDVCLQFAFYEATSLASLSDETLLVLEMPPLSAQTPVSAFSTLVPADTWLLAIMSSQH